MCRFLFAFELYQCSEAFYCFVFNNSGGGSIDLPGESSCIPTPPLSVILSQELVEHIEEDSTTMRLERDLFGMTASITKEAVTLRAFYIVTQIDSVTTRKYATALNLF